MPNVAPSDFCTALLSHNFRYYPINVMRLQSTSGGDSLGAHPMRLEQNRIRCEHNQCTFNAHWIWLSVLSLKGPLVKGHMYVHNLRYVAMTERENFTVNTCMQRRCKYEVTSDDRAHCPGSGQCRGWWDRKTGSQWNTNCLLLVTIFPLWSPPQCTHGWYWQLYVSHVLTSITSIESRPMIPTLFCNIRKLVTYYLQSHRL